MDQKIIEGTWEEVARRGDELAGCRVRLTVLNSPTVPSDSLDRAFAPIIKDAEELVRSLPSIPSSSAISGFSEGIAEKFRRQGFHL